MLLSSPEYAHGVPGSLKNALDWLVGSGELVEKPVALILTSSRVTYAAAQLRETLGIMTARLVPEASIALELMTNRVDEASLLADTSVCRALREAIRALAGAALAARQAP